MTKRNEEHDGVAPRPDLSSVGCDRRDETERRFPRTGLDRVDIEEALVRSRADDDPRSTFSDRWLNDRGLLIDDGVVEIAKEAYLTFFTKNNSYPSVMTLEHDLVVWALDLFNSGPDAVGSLTSGGSESLFLATAAALNATHMDHSGSARPEILMAESGYPAFEKYAAYLGYKVRRVATDNAFRADPATIEQAIDGNTVMIVASVSSWAHGACDPVSELAEVAHTHDIWLHVDACVGGFLAPFVRELGRGEVPIFDFQIPGVESISVDFHKYGYSAKGVSGIFYRHRELSHQPFVFDAWAAGLYRSPVLTGTRSGGAIASAWAVMRYLGRDGYRRRAAQILKARDRLVEFIVATPELSLVGRAELGTVAIGGERLNIYTVAAGLQSRNWSIGVLKDPAAVQLVLGPLRDEFIEQLVSDLGAAVEDARRSDIPDNIPRVVYSDEMLQTVSRGRTADSQRGCEHGDARANLHS